jgi:hypothetical protein
MQDLHQTLKSFAIVCTAAALATLASCSSVEKAKPMPESSRVEAAKPGPQPAQIDPLIKINVPEIMKGTIASEATIIGYENPASRNYRPVIARGYGLVVGLNGNGSRDMPPQIRAYMIAQASKGGFGGHQHGDDIASLSPETLLDSNDTAVVIVEAIIPQGALKGAKFDVRVSALPMTDTKSLEGGTLYTTELRPGIPTTGGAQAFPLAVARGPIFVNPFAEPGAIRKDTLDRTTGRILSGGEVTKDLPLKLRLINPSHSRAAILVGAINTRFSQELPRYAGDPIRQKEPTARGESDSSIELNVPPSYRDRTEEFIDLLRHTSIVQSNPEAIAMSIRRTLLANPVMANAASLRWQALGSRVLPIIKDLYDHPEELPRMAALRAGAKLDDALVIPHLVTMAESGSPDMRVEAIQLLAKLQMNPQVDLALRKLIDDDDVEIRLQAYEALVDRRDPYMQRIKVENKFMVDIVDSKKPLIYITQVGQPRIVLFGPDLEIERPTNIAAWSNRLMVRAESQDPNLEVYYRQQEAIKGVIVAVEPRLDKFIEFLGHTTTIEKPAPGLGLTYGETVGAIHQAWLQKSIKADFRAEQDRILAAIMRQTSEEAVSERPEFTSDSFSEPLTESNQDTFKSDLGRLNSNGSAMTGDLPEPNR